MRPIHAILLAALLAGCASSGRNAPLDPEPFLAGAAAPPLSHEEVEIPFESPEDPGAPTPREIRALDGGAEEIPMPPREGGGRPGAAGLSRDAYEYLHDEDGVWYEGYYYPGGAFVEGDWEDGYFEEDGYYVGGGVLLGVDRLHGDERGRRYRGHHGEGSTGYDEVKRATSTGRAGTEERSRADPTPRSRSSSSSSSGGSSRSGSSPRSVRPRGAPDSSRSAPPPSGGGGTRPPR